jgi:hypothetical protein
MATAKRTPKVSRISRDRTLVAYARKQKNSPGGGDGDDGDDGPNDSPPTESNPEDKATGTPADAAAAATSDPAPAAAAAAATGDPTPAAAAATAATSDSGPTAASADASDPAEPGTAAATPATAGSTAEAVEPSFDPGTAGTPAEPASARTATARMPVLASIGAPPPMPASASLIEGPVNVGSAEDPTRMPGPREIPGGSPDDPASPPGRVPPGDSRSMRRRTNHYEFALIYRVQTYVISRFGVVGTRGQWRVVEYPTSASASHAYAKECSRFVSEGFSDYRA